MITSKELKEIVKVNDFSEALEFSERQIDVEISESASRGMSSTTVFLTSIDRYYSGNVHFMQLNPVDKIKSHIPTYRALLKRLEEMYSSEGYRVEVRENLSINISWDGIINNLLDVGEITIPQIKEKNIEQ